MSSITKKLSSLGNWCCSQDWNHIHTSYC